MNKLGLFVAAMIVAGLPCAGFSTEPPSNPARQTISLGGDWLFQRDGVKPDAWKTVALPASFEQHEGIEFNGIGWYRKSIAPFTLPAGKRVLLHFQAAATEAEVWWNGEKVGTHLGGWTPFRFDITEQVRQARLKGYEGDPCSNCGAFTMVRNGVCLKCDSCGETSGCS